MIDIHSHILPGLDDGSPSLEVSVAMARMAVEDGTTDIVASPHADFHHQFDPALVEEKIAELSEACGGAPRIHYGCDFHLHYENVQDAVSHPSKYAVNHGKYILVELADLVALKSTEQVLERLRAAGITPVITHPERNRLLQRRLDKLEDWVAAGCFLQVTAQSILGGFGNRARTCAEDLIRRGLVHFIASDAHDTRLRPPRLDEARAWVAREFDGDTAEKLFITNPAAVLAGAPLPVGSIEVPPRRKWWQFRR